MLTLVSTLSRIRAETRSFDWLRSSTEILPSFESEVHMRTIGADIQGPRPRNSAHGLQIFKPSTQSTGYDRHEITERFESTVARLARKRIFPTVIKQLGIVRW